MRLLFGLAAIYASIAAGSGQENPKALEHYALGETFLRQQNYQSAANEFRSVLNVDTPSSQIQVKAHIALAEIFIATGQSERAANEYRVAERLAATVHAAEVAQGAIPARPLQNIEPEYSEEARIAGLEGSVVLTATIAEDGSAKDLRVARPLGLGLDEKAIEAVKHTRFQPEQSLTIMSVEFRLPSTESRWHLLRAAFHAPESASRPVFLSAPYPPGVGISSKAADQGHLIGVIGREATATLSFDIDERGRPVHFQILSASDDLWGNEAVALVRGWEFTPALMNGTPVSASCELDLVWGPRELTASGLAWAMAQFNAGAKGHASTLESFPPPPPGVERIWVSADVQAASLLSKIEPEYPPLAKQRGIQGTVRFDALIGTDGRVQSLRVASGRELFVPAASEAARQWVYRPALLNGHPAEVITQLEVRFSLP